MRSGQDCIGIVADIGLCYLDIENHIQKRKVQSLKIFLMKKRIRYMHCKVFSGKILGLFFWNKLWVTVQSYFSMIIHSSSNLA